MIIYWIKVGVFNLFCVNILFVISLKFFVSVGGIMDYIGGLVND